jgi:hypothetical protein
LYIVSGLKKKIIEKKRPVREPKAVSARLTADRSKNKGGYAIDM